MDLSYPAEAEEYRSQVKTFLADNLPDGWAGYGALEPGERDRFLKSWRETLNDNKLLAANWPAEYGGGGLTNLERVVMAEEFAALGVPTSGANDAFSIGMVGNTILQWGTDEQKEEFIPKILSGEYLFCQGYSEPNAGSDLANLGCKADKDGDEYILNGQKIWTSAGTSANWIFVLARTDVDQPKHKGISFFLVTMDQPGIEVRQITNMAGQNHFCEVFLTDARVSAENLLGGYNNGWAVGNTLLGFERGVGAATQHLGFEAELGQLIELARRTGANSDPLTRQRIAALHSQVQIMRYRGKQALTRYLAGKAPGPESSIGKLFWSNMHQELTECAMDVLGAEGMTGYGTETRGGLGPPPIGTANTPGNWMASFFIARPGTIYAGTSEVQKNIIGERVLGLPKEPRADSGTWKESQANYK